MATSLVGAVASSSGSGGTVLTYATGTLPTVAAGDVAYLVVAYLNAVPTTAAAPDGTWTQLDPGTWTTTSNTLSVNVWYKTLTGTESGTTISGQQNPAPESVRRKNRWMT